MKLIVSDAHEGLKAARQNMLAGTPWQRCQFHLMQNAMQYVSKVHLRKQVADELRNIFNARDVDDALKELKRFGTSHEKTAPKLASWA